MPGTHCLCMHENLWKRDRDSSYTATVYYNSDTLSTTQGYGDTVYQERRKFIEDVAYNYK